VQNLEKQGLYGLPKQKGIPVSLFVVVKIKPRETYVETTFTWSVRNAGFFVDKHGFYHLVLVNRWGVIR